MKRWHIVGYISTQSRKLYLPLGEIGKVEEGGDLEQLEPFTWTLRAPVGWKLREKQLLQHCFIMAL